MAEPAPRGNIALLRDGVFGRYFFARLLASIGVWVNTTASAIAVWEFTRSPMLVAGVSLGQHVPFLLAPLSGARADRRSRRRQVVTGRLLVAAGSGVLASFLWLTGDSGLAGAAAVLCAATLVGIGFAASLPAMEAMLPALVRRNELPAAIALSASIKGLAMAAGPVTATLIIGRYGFVVAFAVAAVTSAMLAVTVQRLPFEEPASGSTGDEPVSTAWSYLRSERTTLLLLLAVAAVGVGTDPIVTLAPVIAERLGAPVGFVGYLASAFGLGSLLGFLVMPWIRRRVLAERLAVIGTTLMAAALLLVTSLHHEVAVLVAMGANGLGMATSIVSLTILIQSRVREEFRARIMGLWGVAYIGSRPIAALVSAGIAELLSVTWATTFASAVLLASAFLVRKRSDSSHRDPSRTEQRP